MEQKAYVVKGTVGLRFRMNVRAGSYEEAEDKANTALFTGRFGFSFGRLAEDPGAFILIPIEED